MTMHLERRLSMLRTTKKKYKPTTDKQRAEYEKKRKEHNKFLRSLQMHDHQMDLNEFIRYCRGEKISKKLSGIGNDPFGRDKAYVRPSDNIPLSNNITGSFSAKKDPMVYSGKRRLVGIATMHKSNQVPVFADDDDTTGRKAATEISLMKGNK